MLRACLIITLCFCLIATLLWLPVMLQPAKAISRKAELGKALFFDANLSSPPGQSCASCHDPEAFFVDPDASRPTPEGVIKGRFGPRNAPTVMYARKSPVFHFDQGEGLFVGGQFDDGRARNLRTQAQQPFLQPLEMNNQSPEEVVAKVRAASYADLFRKVYGMDSLDKPG